MEKKLISHKQSLKYVSIAFGLTVGLMFAEFIAAYYANSMALFADGTHLLVHNGSLFVALVTSIMSFKFAKENYAEKAAIVDIIGGIINCSIFLSIAIILFYTGFERLDHQHSSLNINPIIMAISSIVAFSVHCLSAYVLSKGRKHSFNVHAIFLHTLFDCISTILTFIASAVIFFTDFHQIDTITSMLIACLIAFSGLRLLKKCIMKAVTIHKSRNLVKNIDKQIYALEHVVDIHEQEVRFEAGKKVYAAHIVLDKTCTSCDHEEECLTKIEAILAKKFDINDTIIQLEYN
jgi:cobalt-zinc-cadmium efflux system protein